MSIKIEDLKTRTFVGRLPHSFTKFWLGMNLAQLNTSEKEVWDRISPEIFANPELCTVEDALINKANNIVEILIWIPKEWIDRYKIHDTTKIDTPMGPIAFSKVV